MSSIKEGCATDPLTSSEWTKDDNYPQARKRVVQHAVFTVLFEAMPPFLARQWAVTYGDRDEAKDKETLDQLMDFIEDLALLVDADLRAANPPFQMKLGTKPTTRAPFSIAKSATDNCGSCGKRGHTFEVCRSRAKGTASMAATQQPAQAASQPTKAAAPAQPAPSPAPKVEQVRPAAVPTMAATQAVKNPAPAPTTPSTDTRKCHRCGVVGHIQRNCKAPAKVAAVKTAAQDASE